MGWRCSCLETFLVKKRQPLIFSWTGMAASRHFSSQAFLCSGGRYLRPRNLKTSSSEVAWNNVFRSGSNSPWLLRHSPFSCRLNRRSSLSKNWEPVQPRRAKGNWLLGVTTRSTLTAFQVGQGCRAPSKAACWDCGKHKMQKLLSKASMVDFCRRMWAESAKWLRWYWWYSTSPWL